MSFNPKTVAAIKCVACLLAGVILALLLGCQPVDPVNQGTREQFGPVPNSPPTETPTLNYEDFAGLDPQTEITIGQERRINDLEFLVEKHDRELRTLNQLVRGIREVRIGDEAPLPETDQ